METIWQDLRTAARSMRKGALVTSLAAASLALAIAGNAAVFSIVNVVLFPPFPFETEGLFMIGEREEGTPVTLAASTASLRDLAERNRAFDDVAGWRPATRRMGGGDDRPVVVSAAEVSPSLFEIMGADPVRGRFLASAEAVPGNDRVVVISEEFWRRQLAGLDQPLGAELTLDGATHEIVGVAPEGLQLAQTRVDVWVPLALAPDDISRDDRTLTIVARSRAGVPPEQAREDAQRVWKELVEEHPESNRGYVLDVLHVRTDVPTTQAKVLFGLLQGVVLAVLLIASVNVANLMSARSQERRREVAVRTILGASKGRIVRQLLTESLVLAAIGGAGGLALGWVGIRWIANQFAAILPSLFEPRLDGTVLLFTLGLTALAGIVFGVAPAAQTFRLDLAGIVREGGRGTTGSGGRKLLSRSLIVLEVTLSLVLLSAAALMVQSFLSIRSAETGFDYEELVTAQVLLPDEVVGAEERAALIGTLEREAGGVPGLGAVTTADTLPLAAISGSEVYAVDGRPVGEGAARPRARLVRAGPDYLEVIGIRLLAGRFFDDADRADAAPVAVISRELARNQWPDADPIGERIVHREVSREIVGVVEDIRQTFFSQTYPEELLYLPLAQDPPASVYLLARPATGPEAVLAPLQAALEDVDRRLIVRRVQSLSERIEEAFVGQSFFNVVLTAFGGLALLLATMGTYGVLAHNVARRRREVGIRMALGAEQRAVVWMIVRQGAVLGAIGLLLGIPGVLVVERLITNALATITSTAGPTIAVGVGGVLMVTTLIASAVPALRASRLEPTDVLRTE